MKQLNSSVPWNRLVKFTAVTRTDVAIIVKKTTIHSHYLDYEIEFGNRQVNLTKLDYAQSHRMTNTVTCVCLRENRLLYYLATAVTGSKAKLT